MQKMFIMDQVDLTNITYAFVFSMHTYILMEFYTRFCLYHTAYQFRFCRECYQQQEYIKLVCNEMFIK